MKIKSILFAACALISLSGLTACHTVHGAGQDIAETGQTISGTAADVHDNM